MDTQNIQFRSIEFFSGQTIELDKVLNNLVTLGYKKVKSVLQEGDFAQRGGTLDIFPARYDSPLRITLDDDKVTSIDSINLETFKAVWQHKIVIVLPFKISRQVFSSDIPINTFVDIEQGDYVVHNNHGIAKFLGFTELPLKDKPKEHLILEYAEGDRLFVPKHDMHLVAKYVGFSKKPPRLFKLGTKAWKRARALIEKRIQQFAAELIHTQALRASQQGFAFSGDTEWQKEFEQLFPFKETVDQTRSTKEVKTDMESILPMDRLLCGDVGYGKTEVAIRAAFKAVMDNKQVAILVPTTILAEQHFYNFQKRLKSFPVQLAMLSRFRTAHEQKRIIKGLKEGSVDLVIGTHRLLSKDIAFKDLGLLIIDEEQRFGVRAKEKLKHFRLLVDVLTLTATPIPRTLYMAMAGARDMSVIQTAPNNRIAVETHLIKFDKEIIKNSIDRELKRKGQVFFLHNRIHDIDRMAQIIGDLVPKARIAIGHGQMPARQLEEVMLKFLNAEIDVLVSTTIISSGIDVPNANTLIVNRSDQLGLSDLHQLRGRVGRFDQQAYAYFIVPPKEILSPQSSARLKAIEKHSALGSGFQIAFEDLQIRGAGNLLGEQQHGYISTVGFDLYCRLLKESIENLKRGGTIQREKKT